VRLFGHGELDEAKGPGRRLNRHVSETLKTAGVARR
jgi:hypothetical protein